MHDLQIQCQSTVRLFFVNASFVITLISMAVSNMENSLQRIRQKQLDFVDAMAAREEVADSLADVAPEFGSCTKSPIESPESVLARIKLKKDQDEK